MLINYETAFMVAGFGVDNDITIDKIIFLGEWAKEFSNVTMEDVERILHLLKRENRYPFYIKYVLDEIFYGKYSLN